MCNIYASISLLGLVQVSVIIFGKDGGDQPVAWWTANVGVEEEALKVEAPKGS